MQLNDRQLEAVQHGKFPLLVLAGAGTGKTTTIVERIAYAINSHSINPDEILALTFSVDAAGNLKKKLSHKNINHIDLITSCTFHSFAKDIIDDNFSQLGYKKIPFLIGRDELVYLYLQRINKLRDFKSKMYNRFPIKAIKSLLSIHDQFKQELFNDNDLSNIEEKCLGMIKDLGEDAAEKYMQIYDAAVTFNEFSEIRKESSFIEYEDMIYELWSLLNFSDITSELQNKFKFIIIDEFQDNNFAFSEIISRIAIHNNITVVGDDDQSIYSFRGSNSYNMISFDEYYSKNSNYKKIELIQNYRSNQSILDVANTVIVNNKNRMEKEFLVSNSDSVDDESVHLYIGDKFCQIGQVLNLIDDFLVNKSDKTFAVLCRTNSDCNMISKILNKRVISHSYSNNRLFDQRIVKDVVAFLNIISNSKYNLHSLLRLTKNKFNHSFRDGVISLWHKNENILECYANNRDFFNAKEFSWLKNMFLISSNINKSNLLNCIDGFINDNYILSDIDNLHLDDLKNIIKDFYNFYSNGTFLDLCDYINLLSENNNIIANREENRNAPDIALMTVHNSKGMEFDYVVLPFLQSSKFPQSFKNPKILSGMPLEFKKWTESSEDEKLYHINEERRLFYVACTRSKSRLYLLTTLQRQSKFVKEIDENLYLESDIAVSPFINFDKQIQESFSKEIPLELSLSASKLDTYNRCQLKYKYSALDLIPNIKHNSIFSLGNIVHKVLQEFHESGLSTKLDIFQLLERHWNSNIYFYKRESEQYFKDARSMLENYIMYLKDNPASPLLFEAFFEINMNDYILSGFIDRVDVDECGNVRIYDYKTSSSQKSEKNIQNSFQLPIYALAVYLNGDEMSRKIKSRLNPITASELSLRFDDIERSVVLDDLEIKEVKTRISQIVKDISSNIFKANPNLINCNYCDYKKFICSYYN